MITCYCLHCGTEHHYEEKYVELQGQCTKCRASFKIPAYTNMKSEGMGYWTKFLIGSFLVFLCVLFLTVITDQSNGNHIRSEHIVGTWKWHRYTSPHEFAREGAQDALPGYYLEMNEYDFFVFTENGDFSFKGHKILTASTTRNGQPAVKLEFDAEGYGEWNIIDGGQRLLKKITDSRVNAANSSHQSDEFIKLFLSDNKMYDYRIISFSASNIILEINNDSGRRFELVRIHED